MRFKCWCFQRQLCTLENMWTNPAGRERIHITDWATVADDAPAPENSFSAVSLLLASSFSSHFLSAPFGLHLLSPASGKQRLTGLQLLCSHCCLAHVQTASRWRQGLWSSLQCSFPEPHGYLSQESTTRFYVFYRLAEV